MLKEFRFKSELFFYEYLPISYQKHLIDTELTPQAAQEKKNFNFIDTIRCISLVRHCLRTLHGIVGDKIFAIGDTWLQVVTMQFWKFATITFF